jgi:hypothetical protein
MLNLPSNSGMLMLDINHRSRWWLFARSERKINMDPGAIRSMQWIYNSCSHQKNINSLEELGLREITNFSGAVCFGTSQRKKWTQDKMENKREGAERWRMELQEEEHEAMVNQLNILQLRLNEASVHWQSTMEILVEQRQGFQQLKDEVEAICSEVVELRSRLSLQYIRHLPQTSLMERRHLLNPDRCLI